jgi:hypothetical protein
MQVAPAEHRLHLLLGEVEDPGVEQLILLLVARATAVGLDQVFVRISALRIFIKVLHVRVGRRAVEVEVILLDVFAMVALAIGQPVQALLDDRVDAVRQRYREAEYSVIIGNSGQAILPQR